MDALQVIFPSRFDNTLEGRFGQAMSEFVLGWILGLERNIIERAVQSWDATPETGVRGKTMGILGTGSIGSAIAEAVKPLGINCQGMNFGSADSGFSRCSRVRTQNFLRD